METKKNPAKDIHRYRSAFFAIGMLCSIGITITAFEWTSQRPVAVAEKNTDWPTSLYADLRSPIVKEEKKVAAQSPKEVSTKKTTVISDEAASENEDVDMKDFFRDIQNEDLSESDVSFGGDPIPEDSSSMIFVSPERQPEPVGGFQQFYQEIVSKLKYPKRAISADVSGRVFVEFVVERNGEVTNVRTVRGIGYGCDEEAVKAVSGSRWTPGRQRGKPVRVRMIIPITFNLNR